MFGATRSPCISPLSSKTINAAAAIAQQAMKAQKPRLDARPFEVTAMRSQRQADYRRSNEHRLNMGAVIRRTVEGDNDYLPLSERLIRVTTASHSRSSRAG